MSVSLVFTTLKPTRRRNGFHNILPIVLTFDKDVKEVTVFKLVSSELLSVNKQKVNALNSFKIKKVSFLINFPHTNEIRSRNEP